MHPSEYAKRLAQLRQERQWPRSTQFPVTDGEISLFESELGRGLPSQYQQFLREVGSGDEFLGVASWYGYDYASPSNIVSVNEYLSRKVQHQLRHRRGSHYPEDFLVVFDTHDGYLYGLCPADDSRYYQDVMYCWNNRQSRLIKIGTKFDDFLRQRIELLELAPQDGPPVANLALML